MGYVLLKKKSIKIEYITCLMAMLMKDFHEKTRQAWKTITNSLLCSINNIS